MHFNLQISTMEGCCGPLSKTSWATRRSAQTKSFQELWSHRDWAHLRVPFIQSCWHLQRSEDLKCYSSCLLSCVCVLSLNYLAVLFLSRWSLHLMLRHHHSHPSLLWIGFSSYKLICFRRSMLNKESALSFTGLAWLRCLELGLQRLVLLLTSLTVISLSCCKIGKKHINYDQKYNIVWNNVEHTDDRVQRWIKLQEWFENPLWLLWI